jgi:dTDP-4-amino-4,6-dideoxygalactose transaminase
MSHMQFNQIVEYESLAASNQNWMEEIELAATRVVRSGWYILGKEVEAFESEFAAYTGSRYAIGVGNGLDALVLAIESLGLKKGSDILVASNTYIATILAIIRSGFRPILVEPDIRTFNINPDLLSHALTKNTVAICVTHLFGKPCRMDAVCSFARENGLKIIEDCAQSHGAMLGNKMTGTFGDVGCFSFYPTKNLGALGDAGAIITNNGNLAERMLYLRNYGSRQKYVNTYLGFNSRMDEIQAAILRVKLRYLNQLIEHKRELAAAYFSLLPTWLNKPNLSADEYDVFHIYGIRFKQRDPLRAHLLKHGVKTEIHYPIPPHQQKAMKGILRGSYPIAEELHATQLSLPISMGHKKSDIEYVANVIQIFN